MRYAVIKENDIANAPGVCVSIYLQGCPHHCPNCFNPETWDYNGGQEFTEETMKQILRAVKANGINRDLCILGGEPLCPENIPLTEYIIMQIRDNYPEIKTYIWTGYIYESLAHNPKLSYIFNNADYLIDGRFIESLKNLRLNMRGSSNQRIINLKTKKDVTNEF